MNEMLSWISLISGIASLVLAIVAIWFSRNVELQTRNNFTKTQEVMEQQHAKTKEVLSEIDKRAAIMEKAITESQEKLLSTVTNIINEVVIPKHPDMGTQIGMMIIDHILKNPDSSEALIKSITAMVELGQKQIK
jgi:hypothetical protein